MTEREQEIQVSLYADKMLRQALDRIDNNKLIAEFMKLESTPKYNPKEYYVKEHNSGEWYLPQEMQYETYWDWLLPVVKSCREKQFFGSQHLIDNIVDAVANLDIDGTYKAVIEFIKEYNNN